MAGCADKGDSLDVQESEAGPGIQVAEFTAAPEVTFVDIAPLPPRPATEELFNQTFAYSPLADLPDIAFAVDKDWYYTAMTVDAYWDGSLPLCGVEVGDPTDGENWTPQGYLDSGHMPTSGAWVTTPSGYTSWKPYHSGAWCNDYPDDSPPPPTRHMHEYHYFTGEIGEWEIVQSGRGAGISITIQILGTDELPKGSGGSTSTE